MTPLRRRVLLKTLKVFDLLIAVVAFALAGMAARHADPGVLLRLLSIRIMIKDVFGFLAFLFAWHSAFSLCGLYHSRRLSPRKGEIADLLRASTLGTSFLLLADLAFRVDILSPAFVAYFWALASSIALASRLLLRFGLMQVRLHGRNLRHLLIVGANPRTVHFARRIEARPELGYCLVGFVDEDWPGTRELKLAGYRRMAGLGDFAAFIRDHVVDEVVIGLPMKSYYLQASKIVAQCREQGLVVRFLSSLFDVKLPHGRADHFEEDLVVTVNGSAMDGFGPAIKRWLDVALSLVLLLVLAPLFAVAAALIKATSRGPVFFRQDRVGLNKRRFKLYKFRTMVADAEQKLAEVEHLNEVSGPVFKIRNDPRVTAVGRILRRTSIDELPQLINVLTGEMSLVGPRPLPVRDYNGFQRDWERRRFSIRPGITCLWQVNGRSSIPFEQWMELDMQYIDEWSLLLDLKILLKTVPAVLRGSGAA